MQPRPAGPRFETETMRRVPVVLTPEAKDYIDTSSHQGRLAPQALSEAFGQHADVVRVEIHVTRKSEHFPASDLETDLKTGEPSMVMVVDVIHTVASRNHRYFVNAAHLREIDPAGLLGFKALHFGNELWRLYPHRPKGGTV